jgi:hypothetical protein
VVYAQLINIYIIGDALRGEIEAQVGTVSVAGLSQRFERQVTLQV